MRESRDAPKRLRDILKGIDTIFIYKNYLYKSF